MAEAEYVLISKNPPEDQVLLAGDRVFMEWDVLQMGPWFMQFEVAKIEAALNRDGRVELLWWDYNEVDMTLALYVEIKSNTIGQTSMPGVPGMALTLGPGGVVLILTIGVLLLMVTSGMIGYLMEKARRVELWQGAGPAVKKRLEDPDVSEEEKEVLMRGLEAEETSLGSGLKAAAGAVVVVVVVFVGFKILGALK